MLSLSKLKVQWRFFKKTEQNPKICNPQKYPSSRSNPEEEKAGSITLLDTELYYKATVTKHSKVPA